MEGSSGEVRTNFILWGFLRTFPFNGNKKSNLQTSFNGEGEIIKYSLFFFFLRLICLLVNTNPNFIF